MLYPTTFLENKSMTIARYSQPSCVQMYVISQTYTRFGSATSNCRFNLFSNTDSWWLLFVVTLYFLRYRAHTSASRISSASSSDQADILNHLTLSSSCDNHRYNRTTLRYFALLLLTMNDRNHHSNYYGASHFHSRRHDSHPVVGTSDQSDRPSSFGW